ncbi:MAG: metallophosphoesterase [Deltaproteobacteria bacterium]|nr:metallophosphoesterase [Deltaproteobacteria bacterium]
MHKKIVFIISCFIVGVIACYGYFVEPEMIRVERICIPDDALSAALGDTKIVQLSDLHMGERAGRREMKVLQLLADIRPDLIVVTGDMVQWNQDPQGARQFIKKLAAPLGVYGVLGDSDMASGRRHCLFCHPGGNPHLVTGHPKMLKNNLERLDIPATGGQITIAGVFPQEDDNAWPAGTSDPWPADTPVLLLAHFSGGWPRMKSKNSLLWLAGDTHGGQIGIPDIVWRLFNLVDYPQYMAGLFSDGEHKWLYVNRGLGTVSYFPFRIGVPPEITVITFAKSQ